MPQHALTDAQWSQLEPLLSSTRPGPKSKLGDHSFVDTVLYRAKTGIPWRDLPQRFGPWKTVFNRFNNWALRKQWERLFESLQLAPDRAGSIVDATIVRAHQDSAGGKGGSKSTV